MKNTHDNNFIKLSGSASIPSEMEIGTNYKIEAEGTITEKKESDNFDGSLSVTFKFEPVNIIIKDDLGKAIKAKDPRKNSQKIRSYLFKLYSDEGYTEDFDSVYDAATYEILMLMPQILRSAIKRLNK